MDIFGIGPLEIGLILIIALIVLGPNDMVKAGKTIGRFLRKIVTSSDWQTIQQASRDIRYLPNRLMREAGLEEIEKDLKKDLPNDETLRRQIGVDELRDEMKTWQNDMADWTTPPPTIGTPESLPEQVANPDEKADSADDAPDSHLEENADTQTDTQSLITPDKLEESNQSS
jgi:Sec-independent protein translocase protein TatA